MTKFIDDDEDAILQNGILRDGAHLRVHMYAKDGAPLPGFTDVQRAIAASHDAVTFDASLHKPGHRFPSGTTDAAKRAAMYADADRALSDAWRSKAPPTGSYPEGTSHEGSACTVDGAQQTMDAAYAEYDLRIQNSWRTAS
jgi:hypothetical protein